MLTDPRLPGNNPNSRKNLVLTPEQRKKNQEKAQVTRRKNQEVAYEKLWLRAVAAGVMGKSGKEIAKALGVSKGTAWSMKRWAKSRVDSVG